MLLRAGRDGSMATCPEPEYPEQQLEQNPWWAASDVWPAQPACPPHIQSKIESCYRFCCARPLGGRTAPSMSASTLSIDPRVLQQSLCGNHGPGGHPVAGELPSALVILVAPDSSKETTIYQVLPPKVKQHRALGSSLPHAPHGSN